MPVLGCWSHTVAGSSLWLRAAPGSTVPWGCCGEQGPCSCAEDCTAESLRESGVTGNGVFFLSLCQLLSKAKSVCPRRPETLGPKGVGLGGGERGWKTHLLLVGTLCSSWPLHLENEDGGCLSFARHQMQGAPCVP